METIIFSLFVLIFSIVIHEVSHGLMADFLGDPTPKYAGRLSLNPLSHLDLFGSVILPILLLILTRGEGPILGWAKPVPVNPHNFKDRKWGDLKVGLAGPGANLSIALVFGLLMRLLPLPSSLFHFLSIVVILNLVLAIFNLIPIPPLDGSHVLFAFIPERAGYIKDVLRRYGFLILIIFVVLGIQIIFPLISLLYRLIVGQPF